MEGNKSFNEQSQKQHKNLDEFASEYNLKVSQYDTGSISSHSKDSKLNLLLSAHMYSYPS